MKKNKLTNQVTEGIKQTIWDNLCVYLQFHSIWFYLNVFQFNLGIV